MLNRIFSWTVRRRRSLIIAGLVTAIGRLLADALGPASLRTPLGYALLGLVATVLILLIVAWGARPRPLAFDVRPERRSFSTPFDPNWIFATLLILFFGTTAAYALLPDPSIFEWMGVAGWLVAGGPAVRHTWRGDGIELTPRGLVVREPVGVLTVPWEAFPAGQPARPKLHAITLNLGPIRHDLVRRRGLIRRGRIQIESVHPWFLADAIRYYVDHPEHRPDIGSPAEYQRLLRTLYRWPE